MQSAYFRATQQGLKDNEVTQVIWLATADERTCPFCVAKNGNVYRLSEVVIPTHPQCRCTVVPYRKTWEDKGLLDTEWITDYRAELRQELKDAGRKPNTGLTPGEKRVGMKTPPKAVKEFT